MASERREVRAKSHRLGCCGRAHSKAMLYCWQWSTSPNLALIINLRQVLNIVEDPAVKWHKPWLLLHGRRHCNGESHHEFLQPLGTSWASRVFNKDPGIGPMPHESAGREYCGRGRASTYLMSKESIRLHGACCMVTVTSSRQLKRLVLVTISP